MSVSPSPLRNAARAVGQFTNDLWLSRSAEALNQLGTFLKSEKTLLQKAEVPDKPILGPLHAFVLDKHLSRGKVEKLIRSLLRLEGWLRGRAVTEEEGADRKGPQGSEEEGRETVLEANRYIRPHFIASFFQAARLDLPDDLRSVTQTRLVGSNRLLQILGKPGYWKYESELPGGSYTIRGRTYSRMKTLVEGNSQDPAIADRLVKAGLATVGLEIGVQMDLKCGDRYAVVVPTGEEGLAQGIAAWLGSREILQDKPLVLVHTDPSLDVTRRDEVVARYRLDRWLPR